jgi:hypothetical protein
MDKNILLLDIKNDQNNQSNITELSWIHNNKNLHNYTLSSDINLNKIINKLGLGYAIKHSDYLLVSGDINILIKKLEDIKYNQTIDNLQKINKINIDQEITRLTIDNILDIINPVNQLLPASPEQNIIINNLTNHNIIIDSVAGSGKTTTIMHIAKKYDNKKILLLTYNAKLKDESREKVKKYKLSNIEVQNYHSFLCKYYKLQCYTDNIIYDFLNDPPNSNYIFDFDIIIIDEIQDMTFVYYELVLHILKLNTKEFKLCLFGDKKQAIFDFNQADSRFLTLGDKIFKQDNWIKLNLSTSFRITKPMSDFLNRCVLGKDRVLSNKQGSKVEYIVCNPFRSSRLFEHVKKLFDVYNPSDFFIIAPSVKNKSTPVRRLANIISNEGIPMFVPNNDDEKIDIDIINNKLLVSTFHQVKGLERKIVIVFGFDESYFKYYKKVDKYHKCDNALYVALTRATDKLIIIHGSDYNYFKFIDKKKLGEIADVKYFDNIKTSDDLDNNGLKIPVTQLTKHIPSMLIRSMIKKLDYNIIKERSDLINIPIKIKSDDMFESVSEITGTCIQSMYEYKNTNNISLMKNINEFKLVAEFTKYLALKSEFENFYANHEYKGYDDNLVSKHLHMSCMYCSFLSGYVFKLNQIKNYDWISLENLDKSFNRLDDFFGNKDMIYEKMIKIDQKNIKESELDYIREFNNLIINNRIELSGSIDCITRKLDNMYEIKTVSSLKDEHILQLVVYAFMYNYLVGNVNLDMKYNLYNIITDECIQIKYDYELFCSIVKDLIKIKIYDNLVISNDDFLKKCMNISSRNDNSRLDNNKISIADKHNIIILDIETSDVIFGQRYIVQIAYEIYDLDMNFIKKENIYINNGYKNNKLIIDFFKKLEKQIKKHGVSLSDALDKLIIDLNTCRYFVAHNINFDINHINNNIYNLKKEQIKIIPICTMRHTKELVRAKNKNMKLKNPKLSELYKYLYGLDMDESDIGGSHCGDYDVEITALCFKKLIEKEYIKLDRFIQVFNIGEKFIKVF